MDFPVMLLGKPRFCYPVDTLSSLLTLVILLGGVMGPDRTYASRILSSGAYIQHEPIVPYMEKIHINLTIPIPPVLLKHEIFNSSVQCELVSQELCELITDTVQLQEIVRSWSTQTKGLENARHKRNPNPFSLIYKTGGFIARGLPKLWTYLSDPDRARIIAREEETGPIVHVMGQTSRAHGILASKTTHVMKTAEQFTYRSIDHPTQFKEASWFDTVVDTVTKIHEVIDIFLRLQSIMHATSKCETGRISSQLLPPDELYRILSKAQNYAGDYDSELLIPLARIEDYYKLEMVECAFKDNTYIFDISVPIRGCEERVELYTLHPIAYRVQDQVCTMLPNPIQVALIGERIHVLPERFCMRDSPICEVVRDLNLFEIPGCVAGLFPYAHMDPAPCVPQCSPISAPIVTQAGHSTFLIATSHQFPLTVECLAKQSLELDYCDTGALQVTDLPADCAIRHEDTTLVARYLLANASEQFPSLSQECVVPYAWSTTKDRALDDFLRGPILVQDKAVKEPNDIIASLTITHDLQNLHKWLIVSGATVVTNVVVFVCGIIVFAIYRRWCSKSDARMPLRNVSDRLPIHHPAYPPPKKESIPMRPHSEYLRVVSQEAPGLPLAPAVNTSAKMTTTGWKVSST